MAMEAVYFKEPEGIFHNPVGQLSSTAPALWWTAGYGAQSLQPNRSVDHFAASKLSEQGTKQNVDKGSVAHFTISSGNLCLEFCQLGDVTEIYIAFSFSIFCLSLRVSFGGIIPKAERIGLLVDSQLSSTSLTVQCVIR